MYFLQMIFPLFGASMLNHRNVTGKLWFNFYCVSGFFCFFNATKSILYKAESVIEVELCEVCIYSTGVTMMQRSASQLKTTYVSNTSVHIRLVPFFFIASFSCSIFNLIFTLHSYLVHMNNASPQTR